MAEEQTESSLQYYKTKDITVSLEAVAFVC